MFGREYLDWRAEVRAGAAIDAFLSGMEPEDRVWALAVLRKRFEVRVEYRDSLAGALSRAQLNQQNWHANQHSAISVLVDEQRRRASGGPLSFLGL